MASDVTQPVSLVAAGVIPPAGDDPKPPRMMTLSQPVAEQMRQSSQPSMLGGMSGTDVGSLLGTLSQAPPPPSPGLGFGSGVLSAMGGRPGGNPYLSEQQRQAENMQEASRRQSELVMRVRERQLQSASDMADSLLASDDERAQMVGANTKAQIWQQTLGVRVEPQSLVKRKDIPKGERDEIDSLIVNGAPDELLLQRFPSLARRADWLKSERTLMQNPKIRQSVTGMTDDEVKLKAGETSLKLKHQDNVQAAQSRIDAGHGTPQDYFVVGAKDEKEVGRQVFAQYVGTGQPIPPELKPYVDYYRAQLDSSGIKTEVQLAMAAHPGDPAGALAELKSLKRGEKKPTASEFEMAVRLRQEELLDKQRRGIALSDAERREAAANDGYLRGDSNTKTEKGVTRKNVALTVNNAGRVQSSVDQVTKELSGTPQGPGPISTPGQFATDGRPKERVIEEEYHRQFPGQEIQVQWNEAKKQFQVIRLWDVTGGKAEAPTATTPAPAQAPKPAAKGPAKVSPILQGNTPPAVQTREGAVAELQRLMGRGLSKADAITEMKRKGWNVGG